MLQQPSKDSFAEASSASLASQPSRLGGFIPLDINKVSNQLIAQKKLVQPHESQELPESLSKTSLGGGEPSHYGSLSRFKSSKSMKLTHRAVSLEASVLSAEKREHSLQHGEEDEVQAENSTFTMAERSMQCAGFSGFLEASHSGMLGWSASTRRKTVDLTKSRR